MQCINLKILHMSGLKHYNIGFPFKPPQKVQVMLVVHLAISYPCILTVVAALLPLGDGLWLETRHGHPLGPGRGQGRPVGGVGAAVVPVGASLKELSFTNRPADTIRIPEYQPGDYNCVKRCRDKGFLQPADLFFDSCLKTGVWGAQETWRLGSRL